MSRRSIVAALACLIGTTTLAATAEARINQRQHHQHQRIDQGVRSGELTRRETHKLVRQQARIARYEARSRADGRGLTRTERLRIEAMQDRASRTIHRQKHDAQHLR